MRPDKLPDQDDAVFREKEILWRRLQDKADEFQRRADEAYRRLERYAGYSPGRGGR